MTMPIDYSPPDFPPGSTGNENSVLSGKRLGLIPNQGRPALPFGQVLKAAAFDMVVPATDDHITTVPAWNLGQNNAYGTCGPTSLANYMTMVYWNIVGVQVVVSDDAIFALYRASGNAGFPPTPDNGVDLNYMLNMSRDVGLEITYTGVVNPAVFSGTPPVAGATEVVKPLAFGALSTSDLADVKATTAVLGGAELGVTLMVAQQSQSSVWDFSSSPIWGGHAILGAAYTGVASDDLEIISWQRPYGTSDNFISAQLTQAFAVVLPVHLTHPPFLAGVDVNKLASLYQELTGQSFQE